MKKFSIILFVFLYAITSYGQSSSATYTGGNIKTNEDDNLFDCTLKTLTVTIPAGKIVTGVDVSYEFQARNNGFMSEQRSQIYCQETGNDEGGFISGTGNSEGTQTYNRTGLTLANGISSSGTLTFEMLAYRTWTESGYSGCKGRNNRIRNNTWTITVHYTDPPPTPPISGYTGPGGVGSTSGDANNLNLWLRSGEDVTFSSGTNISQWNDKSGAGNNVTQATVANQPTQETNVVNGFSTARFNGTSDVLSSSALSGAPLTIDDYTLFLVWRNLGASPANNATVFAANNSASASNIQFSHSSSNFKYKGDNSSDPVVDSRTNLSNFNITTIERIDQTTDSNARFYVNAENTHDGTQSTTWANTFNLYKFGENRGSNTYLNYDLAETIIIHNKINNAEKVIIQNYLSAKYNIPLNADGDGTTNEATGDEDYYKQDETANGDFDYDVAGIGQDNTGNTHTDSQGTGIVRINTPSNLDNDEYLFWGRNTDNISYSFSTVSYKEKINTTWRVSKHNDLGTVTFSIDMTGIDLSDKPSCSELQLVVDNNSDFSSPTSTYDLTNTSGDLYEVSSVNFSNNDYFTIQYVGNIILDASGFHNGSGPSEEPNESDDCLPLIVKTDASGVLTLTENANVKSLEVEAGGKLVINTDKRIQITDEIELNGEIRLIGSAQIVQTHAGADLNTGSGTLYKDQATAADDTHGGTANFKSIYWSSPVSSSSGNFIIADVLKDGTNPTTASSTPPDIDFISGWGGDDSSPIKISTRWLGKISNALNWTVEFDPSTENFKVGEGWNMKSTDANNQNFTFVGTPNNGTYEITGVDEYVYFLLGNPYPSALDAVQFMSDNEDVLNNTMYFYDSTNDYSYYGADFAGGYGTLNAMGVGVPAAGMNTKTPERYLAVGQGFMMYSLETITVPSPKIVFNNAQRIFKTRADTDSELIARGTKKETTSAVPILRLGFEFLEESIGIQQRELVVGFHGKTSDFENGYDSFMFDVRPTDLGLKSPEIGNSPLVISIIENFNDDLEIPLLLYLNKDRSVTFKINELENFPEATIYLKDAETNQYYTISKSASITIDLLEANYTDRFSIVFKNESSLSNEEILKNENTIAFVDSITNEIVIKPTNEEITKVQLFNLVGQEVTTWNNANIISETRLSKKISPSVYILKLTTKEGKQHSKKIVLK